MNSQDIKELFSLQIVLAQADPSITASAEVLAALIDWKNANGGSAKAPSAEGRPRRGRPPGSRSRRDSDTPVTAPEPAPEPPVTTTRTKRQPAPIAAPADDTDF